MKQKQTIKTLKDGKAVDVNIVADNWQEAADELIVETIESIANETFYHEKLVIFDESGGVYKTFEPEFFSRGDIED